jgi:16S rRNA (cytosine1402-N4)-methyltransferase
MEKLDIVHIPILKNEIINYFNTTEKNLFLDGTAGEGGHTFEILAQFPNSKLILLDRDPILLDRAKKRNIDNIERIFPYNINFSDFSTEYLLEKNIKGIDGILLDFGISMYHIKKSNRGFTFSGNEELDMRLSPDSDKTASDILNYSKEDELFKIFFDLGEENWSKKIANAVVNHRRKNPFKTNRDLAELVEQVIPRKFWPPKVHPAFRIFQALRIEVNDELLHIEKGLNNLIPLLNKGGIICCISFHSLEDRIVKNIFKKYKEEKVVEILTKKPILPNDEEILNNSASRSAKLRVAKKI